MADFFLSSIVLLLLRFLSDNPLIFSNHRVGSCEVEHLLFFRDSRSLDERLATNPKTIKIPTETSATNRKIHSSPLFYAITWFGDVFTAYLIGTTYFEFTMFDRTIFSIVDVKFFNSNRTIN